MGKRKKKGSSRMRPLVFAESPVELSRRLPSPVFAARNPVGADVVSVKEKEQEWVSPQIDPNAPCTPTRHGRTRRNRAACSLDPSTQLTQRRREVARKDTGPHHFTSLQFVRNDRHRGHPRDGTRLSPNTDSSTASDSSEIRPGESAGSRSSQERARHRRGPLQEISAAGRARDRRRRSQSCPGPNRQPSLKKTEEKSGGNLFLGSAGKEGIPRTNSQKIEECLSSASTVLLDQSSDGENDSPESTRLPKSTPNKNNRLKTCSGRQRFSPAKAGPSNDPLPAPHGTSGRMRCGRHVPDPADDSDGGSEAGRMGPRRSTRLRNAAARLGKVLEYDTPETDYGVPVSLRRRKRLLRTPARNKLLLYS